jgi:hypothetical protein
MVRTFIVMQIYNAVLIEMNLPITKRLSLTKRFNEGSANCNKYKQY